MSRVLVTGGAGGIGPAVVRRLLRDPEHEVRVSDTRPLPRWMREGASVHSGDLRAEAALALRGCARAIHLGTASFGSLERGVALARAGLEAGIERLTLVGDEELVRAGLSTTICRLHGVYGPGLEGLVAELLRLARAGQPLPADSDALVALTYVDDAADAIVRADVDGIVEVAASAPPLRTVAELCWEACGNVLEELELVLPVVAVGSAPAAALVGVAPREGIVRTLASLDHDPGGS